AAAINASLVSAFSVSAPTDSDSTDDDALPRAALGLSKRTRESAMTIAPYETPLAKKQPARPSSCIVTAASTGPTTRASWNCEELSAMALAKSSRSTRSTVMAWYEGPEMAQQQPVTNVSTRIIQTSEGLLMTPVQTS